MTYEEYDALPGLNYSSLKDLAISPLRFWHLHLNPEREPEEPSRFLDIGQALHTAVLEPKEFEARYYCELDASEIEGLLVTMDDLKQWLGSRGLPVSAKRKEELVQRVLLADPQAPILDAMSAAHDTANAGKMVFKLDEWKNIAGMAEALASEPVLQELLKEGESEQVLVTTDKYTGVVLKSRLDWVAPNYIIDVKTFAQKRGKSIDKTVADAIYYEGYYIQAYFYAMMRGWPEWEGDYIMPFVESEAPHETRIRKLHPRTGRNANAYWLLARGHVRDMIRLYKECMDHFGVEKPWRYAQRATPLADEELKGLAFS